VEAVHV
jgi:hypothetical protein